MAVVKTNDKSYIYDEDSGALLNNDENEFIRFKNERDKALRIQKLEQLVHQLVARVEE